MDVILLTFPHQHFSFVQLPYNRFDWKLIQFPQKHGKRRAWAGMLSYAFFSLHAN